MRRDSLFRCFPIEPECLERYTRIVKAILVEEDDRDCQNHHSITKFCRSSLYSFFFFLSFRDMGAQHESTLNHKIYFNLLFYIINVRFEEIYKKINSFNQRMTFIMRLYYLLFVFSPPFYSWLLIDITNGSIFLEIFLRISFVSYIPGLISFINTFSLEKNLKWFLWQKSIVQNITLRLIFANYLNVLDLDHLNFNLIIDNLSKIEKK